jgi:hypothetical protein
MERPRRPNYAKWRLQQTRLSILTEKCMFVYPNSVGYNAHYIFIDNLRIRYFEGGVSSVYLWDLDDGGFAGVVLLKKSRFSDRYCR